MISSTSCWSTGSGSRREPTARDVDPQKLIHMANRIGEFFQADPDRQAALEGIAAHLKRFWDPRMRREILRLVDAHEAQGLSPLVIDALHAHRKLIAPGEPRP